MRTASLDCAVFNIEKNKILLQVNKGWQMGEIMKFARSQGKESVKAYYENKDYFPFTQKELDDQDL